MNWIFNQSDKKKHFFGGMIMGLIFSLIASVFMPLAYAMFTGLALGSFVGHQKEQNDRKDPLHHTEEARDSYATFIGVFLGTLVTALLIYLIPILVPMLIGGIL